MDTNSQKKELEQSSDLPALARSTRRNNISILIFAGLVHIELLLIALYIVNASDKPRNKDIIVTTDIITQEYEPIDLNKQKSLIKKNEDNDKNNLEPIVVPPEIDDIPKTINKEDTLNAEGLTEAIADAPLSGTSIMGNIGGGGGSSGAFSLRNGGGKKKAILRGGGSKETESAVDAALYWLQRQQSKNGSWDKRKYGDNGNNSGFNKDQTEGHLALTGLATLAFLAGGNTPVSGKYKETVNRSIEWMLKWQLPDGSFGDSQEFSIYDNSICALVLAELYAMRPEEKYKLAAQKVIDYLADVKKVHRGFSRYPNIPNSTSVNGWMLMAFKSAKIAGLNVPPIVFEKLLKRLNDVSFKNMNGYYESVGYLQKRDRLEDNTTMTAVGMVMFEYLGVHKNELKLLANTLVGELPIWGVLSANHEMYHWYYTTLALYQYGGDNWHKWNKAMAEMLIKNQNEGGPLDGSINDMSGSWSAENDYWGRTLGRIYTTAMGALCLEVYYRYDTIYK